MGLDGYREKKRTQECVRVRMWMGMEIVTYSRW